MYIIYEAFRDDDGWIRSSFTAIGIVKTKKDFRQMAKAIGLKYSKKEKVYYNKEKIYQLEHTKELKELWR